MNMRVVFVIHSRCVRVEHIVCSLKVQLFSCVLAKNETK